MDGNWTDWFPWGSCDVSCGLGIETRVRWCSNPLPARGGKDCVGPGFEERPCNDFPCPGK